MDLQLSRRRSVLRRKHTSDFRLEAMGLVFETSQESRPTMFTDYNR